MTSSSSRAPAPKRQLPDEQWPHHALYKRIREALLCLPLHFRSQTNIEGISAIDIFTLNSALGATIENQVVNTLNLMRSLWDPDDPYRQFAFVRQAQTFPDVLLRRTSESPGNAEDVVLGIELKGWYLLAKEAEPSFRFHVTPLACAPQDLIVVVPWALTNVISGSPMIFPPYIELARYAAEYRNYHWQHLRDAKGDSSIKQPTGVRPYPRKSDPIADEPVADKGGNFGRFARTGLMDEYLSRAKAELLAGIRAEYWLSFFKLFQDQRDPAFIRQEIEKLRQRIEILPTNRSRVDAALSILQALEALIESA
jgi:hypothetical protein